MHSGACAHALNGCVHVSVPRHKCGSQGLFPDLTVTSAAMRKVATPLLEDTVLGD